MSSQNSTIFFIFETFPFLKISLAQVSRNIAGNIGVSSLRMTQLDPTLRHSDNGYYHSSNGRLQQHTIYQCDEDLSIICLVTFHHRVHAVISSLIQQLVQHCFNKAHSHRRSHTLEQAVHWCNDPHKL